MIYSEAEDYNSPIVAVRFEICAKSDYLNEAVPAFSHLYPDPPQYQPVQIDRRVPLQTFYDRVAVYDLVVISNNPLADAIIRRVEIVYYETYWIPRAVSEYAVHLSVYYHFLAGTFPDRRVEASLYFTETGERVPIDLLAMSTIRDRLRTHIGG